jgi:hypothetical protein
MPYLLRILGRGTDIWGPDDRLWLKGYDPEAMQGVGRADLTSDPDEAVKFKTAGEAMKLWATQSKLRPLRPDGKPNRPLTAYTVEVEKEEP